MKKILVLVSLLLVVGCADDSDDARLQAMEDSMEEERLNEAAARYRQPAEPLDPSELSEEERSEKYREAKSIEDGWMEYARRESARRLNPDPNAGYLSRPDKDLNDALGLYLAVAHTEAVAIDDVVRVSRIILDGDPIEKANKEFAASLNQKKNERKIIWSSSDRDRAVQALLEFYAKVKNEKIKAILVDAATAYKNELLALGFKPALRYRSAIDFEGLSWNDRRHKVTHCGQHIGHVNMLAELTAAIEAEDEKMWALHATDVMISDFCCDCSGEASNELANEEAYHRYSALGDNATAKRVARAVASESLGLYAEGWEPLYYGGPEEERPQSIPILLPEHLAEAKEWYQLGGYDEGTTQQVINDRLRAAAADKAEEKRYGEALALYRQIGNKEQARKMELLVGPDGDA